MNGTAKSKVRQRSVWRRPCDILAPNLEELRFNQCDASQLYCSNSPSLFRFTKLCSSLLFNNNYLCYFTEYFNTKPWHTLHFHMLSQVVSGTNRLFVRAIARLQNKTRKVSNGGVWRHIQRSFKHFPQWHFCLQKSQSWACVEVHLFCFWAILVPSYFKTFRCCNTYYNNKMIPRE